VPLAVGIHAAIVDARRAHLQGAAARHALPRRCRAVADHLRPAPVIARVAVSPDVFVALRLERLVQHLQRAAL